MRRIREDACSGAGGVPLRCNVSEFAPLGVGSWTRYRSRHPLDGIGSGWRWETCNGRLGCPDAGVARRRRVLVLFADSQRPPRPRLPPPSRGGAGRLGDVHVSPPTPRPQSAAARAAPTPDPARLRRPGRAAAAEARVDVADPVGRARLSGRAADPQGRRSEFPRRPVPGHGMGRRRAAAGGPSLRLFRPAMGAGEDGGGAWPPARTAPSGPADAGAGFHRPAAGDVADRRGRLRPPRVGPRRGMAEGRIGRRRRRRPASCISTFTQRTS